MILTYFQSSAVMLEHEGVKVLCDPWLVDGELYGSWSLYPPYDFEPKMFENVDYIYLSHIHQDHFSKKTLAQINKEIPIIIFDFKSKALKKGIEDLGFKVIELKHNIRTHLKNNLYINIISADNCNPEICHKYFGCTSMEGKFALTSIDTMCVIDNNNEVVVNINDCPYDLSFSAANLIKEKYKNIDLLLVGHTSASAYPQCFIMNEDEKQIAIQKLKNDFLLKAERYVDLFKPKYFMPFAGRYTLTGKLSKLNKFKGTTTIEEAYNYFLKSLNIDKKNHQCFLLNPGSSFDINAGKSSKQYSPVDVNKQEQYVIEVLSKRKLDYEYEKEPTEDEILSLVPKAFERFESKRSEIGFESDTEILIRISENKFIAISCNGNGYRILAEENANFKKFVRLTLDRRLLKWLLLGPRYAYWGTAENGSHIIFERNPNVYERGLYFSLSFFYS